MTALAERALALYRETQAANEAADAQMAETEHAEQTAETLRLWGLTEMSEYVPDRIDSGSLWLGDIHLRRTWDGWLQGWVWEHVWPISDADGPITRPAYDLYSLGVSLYELTERQRRLAETEGIAPVVDAILEPLPADALTRIADALDRLCEIWAYMIPA